MNKILPIKKPYHSGFKTFLFLTIEAKFRKLLPFEKRFAILLAFVNCFKNLLTSTCEIPAPVASLRFLELFNKSGFSRSFHPYNKR